MDLSWANQMSKRNNLLIQKYIALIKKEMDPILRERCEKRRRQEIKNGAEDTFNLDWRIYQEERKKLAWKRKLGERLNAKIEEVRLLNGWNLKKFSQLLECVHMTVIMNDIANGNAKILPSLIKKIVKISENYISSDEILEVCRD